MNLLKRTTAIRSRQWILAAAVVLLLQLDLAGDGLIVIPRPPHQPTPFPLEVRSHRVEVSIRDQVATTAIDQEFFNPTGARLEGYYLFPIPRGAIIKKFSMFIDGRETEAELLDAQKARRIYEDIVRRLRDPALLEYGDRGAFKVRIFPIEPMSVKRVKISYVEILAVDNRISEYVYPLNTEKFSAKPLKDVSVKVDLQTRDPLKTVYCPSHQVEINRHQGERRATVAFEAHEVKPDTDFRLFFHTAATPLALSLLSTRQAGEDGFFLLTVSPELAGQGQQVQEKEIAFVLDVSGSMAGENLRQAKRALLFCLEHLNSGDSFNIIRFSTEAEALFPSLATAHGENLKRARTFVDELKAIGGTNVEEALKLALEMKKDSQKPFLVVFITDGKPTIGLTDEEPLLRSVTGFNNSQTRIFSFGIGHEINTHLLDRLAEMTRGFSSYIQPQEDIEIKISSFYTKVRSPVLTNLKLEFAAPLRVTKTYPKELPDLFAGSSLTVLGRYDGSGRAKVTLTGQFRNQKREFATELEFTGPMAGGDVRNDFIPPLWAARRIGFLLDQIRLHGQERELVDEVVELARRFGIVTPYTSYLIVEDESSRLSAGSIRPEDQTLNQIASQSRDFARRTKAEYENLAKKSGAESVQVSNEFKDLTMAAAAPQTRPGESRQVYQDGSGRTQNLGQQVRNVQGRAFYQTGSTWVDSSLQSRKAAQVLRVRFASDRYFELLQKEKGIEQFLALGNNVRFFWRGQVVEVTD